ncbi:MAG: hypothetical protein ACTHMI_03985 [Mucilaginibacter sp.]
MDWEHYIVETFFTAWEEATPVDLSDYAFLIQHHFDVPTIGAKFVKQISASQTPEIMERFHMIRLQQMIRLFIRALLNISDDGKHINNNNIERAKRLLQRDKECMDGR